MDTVNLKIALASVTLMIIILLSALVGQAHQVMEYKRILIEHNIAEYNSSGEFQFKKTEK